MKWKGWGIYPGCLPLMTVRYYMKIEKNMDTKLHSTADSSTPNKSYLQLLLEDDYKRGGESTAKARGTICVCGRRVELGNTEFWICHGYNTHEHTAAVTSCSRQVRKTIPEK